MLDPYTSECGHSFSAAILELIKNGRGQCDCPITGCSTILTKNNIKQDKRLAKKIARAMRLEQQTQQEQEDSQEIDF